MRRAGKREILNLIDTLKQTHGEIRKAVAKRDIASAQEMLAECQNLAVEFGTAVEKSEGEGFITVSHVEQYCETVFRVYEELNTLKSNFITAADKGYKILNKQLLRVENSVKNDIPVRTEVVFFSYKASMWDSLESVYLAARKDPDCDAYCVPIPYYDKNADKSLGAMHYEGDQYPTDIEVTDWRSYDFEERRPDAVYIHYPYDNWNFATDIPARFYAKNLRQYTDMLVYIPYFVLDDIEPGTPGWEAYLEKMKHFCFLPGVIYADKVIVQSENMRQIYIEQYMREAKENGLSGKHVDRKYLEEKILGLGSPKYDKLVGTDREKLNIPPEWNDVINCPDGRRKKIIFYNTSIAALLDYGEKWVDKLEDVLKIFKANQEDVTLLWRPHPLIENTMQSMYPELVSRYLEIKNSYKNEGWGILDETADIDRAVILSDGYYGDRSSVVQLYQRTGKPIMIQNINVSIMTDKENEVN